MLGIGIDAEGEGSFPLAFLLGAGASHSSGGPPTASILEECKQRRPNFFPDDEAVYEKFSDLTPRERDRLIRPLFKEVIPYVGYRCLVAMAKARPVFVVDLNWDNCVGLAAEKADIPFSRFDLKNPAKGRALISEVRERGHGIVCAHVHGYLDASEVYRKDAEEDEDAKHGIRFSRPDTSSFDAREMQLLEELLAPPTIVVGTSLIGSPDAHQMLQALLPSGNEEKKATALKKSHVEALWVFERGEPARAPGFDSRIAVALSNAMLARDSFDNFVSDTNVDFDLLLTALRAEEIGLPWPQGRPSKTQLPPLEKLVPPNPKAVRPLLDGERALIVGAPYVGSSTLAYLLAWWQGLMEVRDLAGPRRVLGLQGPGQALDYLQEENLDGENVGTIVIDDVFDERGGAAEAQSFQARLAKVIRGLGDRRVFATASPDAALVSACGPSGAMHGIFDNTVVTARGLWRPSELRAWAKARGGDRAEAVCREIRMGLITTPSQAVRTLDGHVPYEQQPDWRQRLRYHLEAVYKPGQKRALALALLRLQDFGVPRSGKLLAKLTGTVPQEELENDPWGLCMPMEVDGERYLRLANPGVARAVDDWIDSYEDLEKALRATGVRGSWTVEALNRWRVFRDTDACDIPADFGPEELELFGSEYVKRALEEETPDAAVEALWRIWESTKDHWTAKEVALDLVFHWDRLQESARARALRGELLRAKNAMGTYALFEAIMRLGRPVPIGIWAPTISRLVDLAQMTHKHQSARRQIALSFDAVLWRRCPVSQEQERKLIELLLTAAQQDDRLAATMAAACVYHYDGAVRLEKAGYDLPILGVDLDAPKVREMAWLVAWHFAHQSRCRALATRRSFLSTLDHGDDEGPHYLDRAARQNQLDAEHRIAVVRYVDALLRHPETAGWALHLIMNIHTTTGTFKVSDEHIARLHKVLSPKGPGRGVLTAALTYRPTDQIHQLLLGLLKTPEGTLALQEGLRKGVEIEGTDIAEPRFAMGSDPWAIRRRWDALPADLPMGATVPQELIGGLAARVDSAVAEGEVDRAAAERAIAIMSRGHTYAAEVWQRPPGRAGEDYLPLLKFVADYYSKPDDEW
jgi:hypothetical protein